MGSWAVQLPNTAANAEKTKLLNGLQLRRFISASKAIAKSDGEGLTFTLSSAGTAFLVLRYRLSGGRSPLVVALLVQVSTCTASRA